MSQNSTTEEKNEKKNHDNKIPSSTVYKILLKNHSSRALKGWGICHILGAVFPSSVSGMERTQKCSSRNVLQTVWGPLKPSQGRVPQTPPTGGGFHPDTSLPFALSLRQEAGRCHQLYGHRRVHLLLAVGVREGGLDLPVAGLQAVHERGHRRHRHRVVLHRVAHVRGVQVLPLVRHDLGGLLTVQHGEIRGHVHVHVVHGALWQATVGL